MQKIENRLKRLQGQISALEKLIKQPDCEKTIIQFLASKAALEATFSAFLEKKVETCLAEKSTENLSTLLKLIVKQ